MPTLPELRARYEAARLDAERRAADADGAARRVLSAQQAAGGDETSLPPAQAARLDGLIRQRREARADIARAEAQLDAVREAEGDLSRERAAHRMTVETPVGRRLREGQTARLSVGRNERTYREDLDPSGRNFLLDVCRGYLRNDPGASSRLERHMEEEAVERPGPWAERASAGDTLTSNWAGLTVPAYLTNLVADQIGALRPFADLCCVHTPLPPHGMTVNFSKVTTGSSVALQSPELSAVSATSLDDTLGQANVQTAAGQQTISLQAVQRGTGIEDTTWRDLSRKYAAALDSTLLTQASTGLSNVAQTVAYTSGSPTGAEM